MTSHDEPVSRETTARLVISIKAAAALLRANIDVNGHRQSG